MRWTVLWLGFSVVACASPQEPVNSSPGSQWEDTSDVVESPADVPLLSDAEPAGEDVVEPPRADARPDVFRDADLSDSDSDSDTDAGASAGELQFLSSVGMGPGTCESDTLCRVTMTWESEAELAVRYLLGGRAVESAVLRFTAVGAPPSLRIDEAFPTTDAEGIAGTTMSVGEGRYVPFSVEVDLFEDPGPGPGGPVAPIVFQIFVVQPRPRPCGIMCCKSNSDCVDDLACTVEACVDGECVITPSSEPCCAADLDCDDGLHCTADTCVSGFCSYSVSPLNCCEIDAECVDSSPCTLDQCIDHQCMHSLLPDCCTDSGACNDSNVCTQDLCQIEEGSDSGVCVHETINQCCVPDEAFNDTTGVCVPPGPCFGTQCVNGNCVFPPIDGCCEMDSDCPPADDSLCFAPVCVDHVCAAESVPGVPGCCLAATDCISADPCLAVTCNLTFSGGQCEFERIDGCGAP